MDNIIQQYMTSEELGKMEKNNTSIFATYTKK
jgi:hypothetical protein